MMFFGTDVGDQLLVQLTTRIHRHLSKNEKILRIGGRASNGAGAGHQSKRAKWGACVGS